VPSAGVGSVGLLIKPNVRGTRHRKLLTARTRAAVALLGCFCLSGAVTAAQAEPPEDKLLAEEGEPEAARLLAEFEKIDAQYPLPPRPKPSKDGASRRANLFVVPISIPSGSLVKLLDGTGATEGPAVNSFDAQLTGRLHVKVSAPDPYNFAAMPLGAPSGVRVFAISFEKSPVTLKVEGSRPWNVFPRGEKPVMNVTLENVADRTRRFKVVAEWGWGVRSRWGPDFRESWAMNLAPGERKTIRHAPKTERFGTCGYAVTVTDGSGVNYWSIGQPSLACRSSLTLASRKG